MEIEKYLKNEIFNLKLLKLLNEIILEKLNVKVFYENDELKKLDVCFFFFFFLFLKLIKLKNRILSLVIILKFF
jgi:hypothetical protein